MDLTLREFLDRYGPTIALILAIIILVAVFPASKNARVATELASGEGTLAGGDVAEELSEGTEGGASGAAAGGSRRSNLLGGSGDIVSLDKPGGAAKACGVAGRMPGISPIMPPCVSLFSGDNGGETARGVHRDHINIVRYRSQVDPATQAALVAAGADDTREDQDRMDAALVDYFKWHYESYGREPKIITMDASGPNNNDAAMKADAKTIADTHKAFINWGGPDVLAEELAARGVICICTTSLSTQFYAKHRGYIFSSLPTAEEYYTATAEYLGKRLKDLAPKHAGSPIKVNDPSWQPTKRKFGLVYLEATSAGPRRYAKEGREFFLNEIKAYGITDVATVGYSSRLQEAQQQTTNVIAKMVQEKVTTIALAADPLFPIFLTQEATKQQYFPEWIIMGTALTDTTFFGRTYDQAQWQHAFGISPLWVFWIDVSSSSGYREYHHARPGSNRGDEGVSINVRRAPIQWILQGIHMAGPNLTPQTFAQGMYNFPKSGGTPDVPLVFFTPEHPMAIKDFTEVWWKPDGSGRDETGKDGPGTLMKVDGGRRWLTGTWPATEPKVFVNEGAVYTKDFPVANPHEADGHKHNPKLKCMSC